MHAASCALACRVVSTAAEDRQHRRGREMSGGRKLTIAADELESASCMQRKKATLLPSLDARSVSGAAIIGRQRLSQQQQSPSVLPLPSSLHSPMQSGAHSDAAMAAYACFKCAVE